MSFPVNLLGSITSDYSLSYIHKYFGKIIDAEYLTKVDAHLSENVVVYSDSLEEIGTLSSLVSETLKGKNRLSLC